MNSSYLQHIPSNKEQLIKEQLIKEQLNKIQEYNKKYIELENKYVNSSHFIRIIFYFFAVFFLLMFFQYNLQEKMTYCIKSKDLQHELYNTKIEPKQTTIKIIRI